jgi:hypothetical protein
VPSFPTESWVLLLPETQAYLEAATAVDNGKLLAFGTTFCCCSPLIVDNPLYNVQLMANSIFPQNGASMCPSRWAQPRHTWFPSRARRFALPAAPCASTRRPTCPARRLALHASRTLPTLPFPPFALPASYNALCGQPCTACFICGAGCLNKLQCVTYDYEGFETQEDALAALLAVPANPAVPDQIAGVWGFHGNPCGEQMISLSPLEWKSNTRILRGDHIFMREGWVERGDACGAFQQCIMSTGCQPGLFIRFKDDSLREARITLTLDPVCCPGTCFWCPCATICGKDNFPCATGVGFCIAIPQFINSNTFTVIGGSEGPKYTDWRNRQIGACSLPLTCCNLSYTTRKLAQRDGTRIDRNWELYNKWVQARAGTCKGMRMLTQPYGEFMKQPGAQEMERA